MFAVMPQVADMIGTAQDSRIRLDFIKELVDGTKRFICRNTTLPAQENRYFPIPMNRPRFEYIQKEWKTV